MKPLSLALYAFYSSLMFGWTLFSAGEGFWTAAGITAGLGFFNLLRWIYELKKVAS